MDRVFHVGIHASRTFIRIRSLALDVILPKEDGVHSHSHYRHLDLFVDEVRIGDDFLRQIAFLIRSATQHHAVVNDHVAVKFFGTLRGE